MDLLKLAQENAQVIINAGFIYLLWDLIRSLKASLAKVLENQTVMLTVLIAQRTNDPREARELMQNVGKDPVEVISRMGASSGAS